MKAIPSADNLRLESENDTDVAIINFLTRGRRIAIFGEGLGRDQIGRRMASMTIGVDMTQVAAEAKELLDISDRHTAELEHLLAAIPPCPAHGEGCIAHALEWVAKAKTAMQQVEGS